jgi:hypothetical protein
MLNLYSISDKNVNPQKSLGDCEKFSVYYHDIFDYPLTFADLIKWNSGKDLPKIQKRVEIISKNGYFTLSGKEGLIYKRALRERISAKKLEIARKASKILSFIPSVKFVGVTGSLAMSNSSEESDIDLLIITKNGRLWTSRLFAYLFIAFSGIQTRRPFDRNQKDKLCLNMWLDESDLVWRSPRNVYTAHEIGQILPLINKDGIYEEFLEKNKWILKYWPNSVKIQSSKVKSKNQTFRPGITETLAFWLQRKHMKSKMTREVITKTRAIFHPNDWGEIVLSRLSS